ncbi:hypothetical protein [Streptomyces sp. NPDC002088]|uniref:hypothetical protein n=1 Tax=Streptomyces sp. NPDC002088 TaxID=3154665 RepID=UPI00332B4337
MPVRSSAARGGGELVEVLAGLDQAFVPGGLLPGRDSGGVDQDPAHGQGRVVSAAPGQGVGVLQDPEA